MDVLASDALAVQNKVDDKLKFYNFTINNIPETSTISNAAEIYNIPAQTICNCLSQFMRNKQLGIPKFQPDDNAQFYTQDINTAIMYYW
jgi:hypothetical protein